MNQVDQQDAFAESLERLIDRFISEFDLSLVSAIGVLEVAKNQLLMEQMGVVCVEEDED
jgi:hypothetical protein